MIRHIVLFSYKQTASDEDLKELKRRFKELPSLIPLIKQFECGTNNSPEDHRHGFTEGFVVTFDSEKDRDEYLIHPDHKAFSEFAGPFIENVLCFDYSV